MSRPLILRLGPHVSLPIGKRFLITAPLLVLLLLLSAYLALNIGTTRTELGDALAALFLPPDQLSETARTVANFRMPRIGVAILGGAMTAAAGYLLQVASRNGLADPGILGLSDGAVVTVMLAGLFFAPIAAGVLSLVALGGALLAALVVLGLGRHLMVGGGILLVGIAVNLVLGSVIEIVLVSGDMMEFAQLMTWQRGSLAAVNLGDLHLLAFWFSILVPLVLLTSRFMLPMLLGHDTARALGIRAGVVYPLYVLMAAALAAPVVATCGPIAFVGLMSSYIARRFVGDRPTEVAIAGMLSGAIILLWADSLGRSLFAPVSVPAGIMVSVVGVITFVLAAQLGRKSL